ncbi:MAG: DUF2779 domain-containing protein [Sulfurovum sp.]|nr:DUF2779 domain-containing protein [Sulfurovum sp.]
MRLSKSLYTRGLQCGKSLWLKKYTPEVLTPPDAQAQAVFETGSRVGELACNLFPGGIEIPYEGTTYDEKVALTQHHIDEGVRNIYEASFSFDDIFVMVDILHVNEDGSVEIYEVKSSTEVKDVYLHDVSIQYYVLRGLGYEIKKVSVIHIDNTYVRGDELEIDKLFAVVDVTEEAVQMQEDIPTYLRHFALQLSNRDNPPDIDIGKQCNDPYACDGIEHCWAHIPSYSIFDISRLRSEKKFALYGQGIVSFEQIEDRSIFSVAQQIQIESEQTQRSIVNKEAIKEFLDGLSYPIYHLDFETFQQAIPEWKGISPFMQIPFQYSVHIEQADGSLEHREFLAEDGKDPRYALAKRLIEDIPVDVTVLAYNMGFEKGVIRRLAAEFPEFGTHLMAIHDNVQDLMAPFAKKDYYTPAMRGSYSIKYVLPALVPEMAEAYKQLELVHNGGEAMQTFANLSRMNDEEKQVYRDALLEYCKLDTLAMVKVLDKLKESVKR